MKTSMHSIPQCGAALVAGLVLLVAVSLIGFASIRSNRLGLRMADNLEAKNASFQQAQAALDFLVSQPTLLPVVGTAGYTFCTANLTEGYTPCGPRWGTCTERTIDLPAPMDDGAGGPNALQAIMGSTGGGLMLRGLATSYKFTANFFEARSCYDGRGSGAGSAEIVAGLMRVSFNNE